MGRPLVFLKLFGTVLCITLFLVGAPMSQHAFSTGSRGFSVDGMLDTDSDIMIRRSLLDGAGGSSGRPITRKRIENSGRSHEKVLKFVDRIVDLENSVSSIKQSTLSDRQRYQLKQMTTQLKLIKTLFERSVFLMELVDFASKRTDSSPWIPWVQLEPAAKELEENIRTLRTKDEALLSYMDPQPACSYFWLGEYSSVLQGGDLLEESSLCGPTGA
ncbi:hypothetical protein R1sor_002703 [Riccia sorocarpa]|uniref:Uncharacterized protein n=1 Tax=Riccia sorocarpa TaxID=122646 RepID=A0ABD3H171_9MARC